MVLSLAQIADHNDYKTKILFERMRGMKTQVEHTGACRDPEPGSKRSVWYTAFAKPHGKRISWPCGSRLISNGTAFLPALRGLQNRYVLTFPIGDKRPPQVLLYQLKTDVLEGLREDLWGSFFIDHKVDTNHFSFQTKIERVTQTTLFLWSLTYLGLSVCHCHLTGKSLKVLNR